MVAGAAGRERPPLPEPSALTAAIGLLRSSAEWRVLAPLVARGLGADPPASVTGADRNWLQAETRHAVALALARRALLARLGERAAALDLPLVLLKGAALNGWIYPDDAPRGGVDIDLLIRPVDRPRLPALLDGLALAQPHFPGRPHLARLAFERCYVGTGAGATPLDIHWALTYPALYRIDGDGLFRRARPHPRLHRPALRVPAAGDMLLHLAVHALYDLKAWGRHDLDAAALLWRLPVDWPILVARAQSWGAGAALYLLLCRAHAGLGAPVPDEVLSALRPGAPRRLLGRVLLGRPLDADRARVGPSERLRQLGVQFAFAAGPLAALHLQGCYLAARARDGRPWSRPAP